jgi:hypothetical protein
MLLVLKTFALTGVSPAHERVTRAVTRFKGRACQGAEVGQHRTVTRNGNGTALLKEGPVRELKSDNTQR